MLEAPIAFAMPPFDSSADISDLWQERTDPENALGQTAEAHFAHNARTIRAGLSRRSWWQECRPELVGVTVTGGDAPRFWSIALPRSIALAALGADAVAALETALFETLEKTE